MRPGGATRTRSSWNWPAPALLSLVKPTASLSLGLSLAQHLFDNGRQRLTAALDLHKALGGGWQAPAG